ncbi:ParB N-terminal domain-containing protein [Streptomyces yunnanensis]|uniref:ParB N-terminal domain-containing protein n=1 Tax=Streptomyces yunnanensis TaxID=156453 RepID=A0ABY8AKC6_9ACTN|nr:ParB N-terminal domain-containing protein [Streptomyces yunnanensis]WEB45488.1 ParB N-terminal domain-containing protein [Streptomyces yunnanensis]
MPITLLLPADSPRLSGENMEHARALAASEKEFPPIVVHRSTMRVIDGMHRLRVALIRGCSEIAVRFFEGSEADAFVLAVESNVGHGLPLTLTERTAAAARIVLTHPQWSDRAIASTTGLSATTVGALRRREGVGSVAPTARIGRDGKVRPLSTEEGRRAAGKLITESPDAPLREIAKKAGISPGTVRDVRERLQRGEDPVPATRRSSKPGKRARLTGVAQDRLEGRGQVHPSEQSRSQLADGPSMPTPGGALEELTQANLDVLFRNLCRDPSLRHTEMGRLLLRMLDMQLAGARCWNGIAQAIPAHRTEMVSAAAAQCARAWEAFASELALRRIA